MKRFPKAETSHIAHINNHAGYVHEEDEFSTNPDNLYIGDKDTKEMTLGKDDEMVDHKEVIDRYVAKLQDIANRLKMEKDARVINKLNKIKTNIIQSLFNERGFIEKIKKMRFQEFIASLER